MATFTKSDVSRIAISAFGALALTSASVLFAAAPAKAERPLTLAAWNATVQHRIEMLPQEGRRFQPAQLRTVGVAVHFTGEGEFQTASLAQSSGDSAIDRRAVQIAERLGYPKLPVALRGEPRDVIVRIQFGDGATMPLDPIKTGTVEMARRGRGDIRLAAK